MFDYINEYCVQERRIKGATILQYNRDYKSYIQKYSKSCQQLQNLSKDVFNDYYAKLAEKYAENCYFLNATEQVEAGSVDHLHLDTEGHARMAQLVKDKINEIFAS